MNLIGNFTRSGKNENDDIEITLSIHDKYKSLIKELNKEELYSIIISKARSKRTERQNNYMWRLISEIDKARNGERSNEDYDIYIEALTRAGSKFTHLLIESKAKDLLKDSFRAVQLTRQLKVGDKKFYDYKCFYGSSKLNTKEMKDLIDTLLDMAIECGLDIIYWRDLLVPERLKGD